MSAIKDWAAYAEALKGRGREMKALHPEIVKGFTALSAASTQHGIWMPRRAGSSPWRVAITTKCEGCIEAHVKKAKAAGAAKEEIAEALGVAIALNAGAAFTYALHALDAAGSRAPGGAAAPCGRVGKGEDGAPFADPMAGGRPAWHQRRGTGPLPASVPRTPRKPPLASAASGGAMAGGARRPLPSSALVAAVPGQAPPPGRARHRSGDGRASASGRTAPHPAGPFPAASCRITPLQRPKAPTAGKGKSAALSARVCRDGGAAARTGEEEGPGRRTMAREAQPKAGWCPGAESNHRHCDFQSHALPTELPGPRRHAPPVEVPRIA